MSWENLTWRPADASYPEGIAPILNEKDLLQSALEEAVSSMLMASVSLTAIDVAEVASSDELPGDFMTVATFEMLGKERTAVAVALEPGGGDMLAGSTFDPGEMGWNLAEALDQAVEAIAGEGLQAQMADGGALPAGEPLVLLRLTLTDGDGNAARLVAATIAEVPADLAMHLILVKEIGKITLDAPTPKPAPAPAPAPAAAAPEPAPAAVDPAAGAPMAMPGAMPGATPGGMPGTMPGAMPGGMPGAMPGGMPDPSMYPGYAAMPGGYPMPGAYPGMPTMAASPAYPGYPGMPGYGQPAGYPTGGYPGAAIGSPSAGYPANVRPLTLDELAPTGAMGIGSGIDMLSGVNLEVTVEIGRTRMSIRDVLALGPGSLVELDKLAGDKVDVLVNGHLIASGEVIVYEENFGVRITDVSARARRIAMGEGVA